MKETNINKLLGLAEELVAYFELDYKDEWPEISVQVWNDEKMSCGEEIGIIEPELFDILKQIKYLLYSENTEDTETSE